MAENLRLVGIGEMAISADSEDILVVYGLGSCVAICLYDPQARVGGMLHALLPTSVRLNSATGTPTKFVDQGIPLLIEAMVGLGAKPIRLITCVCGGARLLTVPSFNNRYIGQLNLEAAKQALQTAGLVIRGQSTGGRVGRTVKLYIVNGHVTVKTLNHPEQVLTIKYRESDST